MDALERTGVITRVMSAMEMRAVAEPYIRRRAPATLKRAASSSSAPAPATHSFPLKPQQPCVPSEIDADVVIKATKVDGIYDADPQKNRDAKKFPEMTHLEFLSRRLAVMDSTAVTLAWKTTFRSSSSTSGIPRPSWLR